MPTEVRYVGERVFHRRADLFGRIEAIEGAFAKVKYEWPYDSKAPPAEVPITELSAVGKWE